MGTVLREKKEITRVTLTRLPVTYTVHTTKHTPPGEFGDVYPRQVALGDLQVRVLLVDGLPGQWLVQACVPLVVPEEIEQQPVHLLKAHELRPHGIASPTLRTADTSGEIRWTGTETIGRFGGQVQTRLLGLVDRYGDDYEL